MITIDSNKKRHFLVTLLLATFFITDSYHLKTVLIDPEFSNLEPRNFLFGMLSVADIVFILSLFYWKKWGFWGIVFTSLVTLSINIYDGVGVLSLIGLLGTLFLFLVLQLKRDGMKGWNNLE